MNPPPLLLRSTIFMDLLGESPIGAWATLDDCPEPRRSGDVTANVDANGVAGEPFPSDLEAAVGPGPTSWEQGRVVAAGKDAPQEIKRFRASPEKVS
jgi:hypothetical protein